MLGGTQRRRLAVVAGAVVVYAAVLQLAYMTIITGSYAYLGYRARTPNPVVLLLTLLLAYAVTVVMPRRLSRASDLVLWLMLVLGTLPAILVPAYADILSVGDSARLSVVVAVTFIAVVVALRVLPRRGLPLVPLPARVVWLGVAVFCLVVYGYMFFTVGLRLQFISLLDVTAVRLDYRRALQGSGALLGYLIPVQGNVVNPLIMATGLRQRRWWMVVLGALGQALIFSVTGYKLVLLTVPALVVLWYFVRRDNRPPALLVLWGVAAVAWFSVAVDTVRTTGLTQIFVNRLLATPGVLVAAHVMVFSDRPKAHWAYSFLSPFLHYPYSVTPPFLVGRIFSHSDITSANSNLFGDGYANLGYLGMVVEAAFLVLLLWAVDSSSRGLPMSLLAPVYLAPSIALANVSVFTSVLSSGFAVAIVICLVMPRSRPGGPAAGRPRRRPRGRPGGRAGAEPGRRARGGSRRRAPERPDGGRRAPGPPVGRARVGDPNA